MARDKDIDIRWLLAGALVGLAAAGYGMLRQADSPHALSASAIAAVNGVNISRASYDRELERSGPSVTSQDGAWLLAQLIDEELLVQRGIELGMAQSDSTVRNAIVTSLVASVTAEADAASPGDDALRVHLERYPERFSYVTSVAVDAWISDAQPAAQAVIAALQSGEAVPDGSDAMPLPDLPDGRMPIDELASHVGPGIAAAAADMPIDASAIFARRGRWLVLRVRDKATATETELDSIRNRVLIDYRRQLADDMLEAYLQDLRQRADIVVQGS